MRYASVPVWPPGQLKRTGPQLLINSGFPPKAFVRGITLRRRQVTYKWIQTCQNHQKFNRHWTASLSQKLRLHQRLSQKPLRLRPNHRPTAKVPLRQKLRLHQRLSQKPLRLNRDHRIDRATVGKDNSAAAGGEGEGVASLTGKVSTITVRKNSRPSFQMILNSSKQNHVL